MDGKTRETLKPIETLYAGYKFRSRIEARWAVFFDVLGIKWEYEKEGYDLDGVSYLPDFWLPDKEYWVEIKGQDPTPEEEAKCIRLYQATRAYVFMFVGPVPLPPLEKGKIKRYHIHGPLGRHLKSRDCAWSECPGCGDIGIALSENFVEGTRHNQCECIEMLGGIVGNLLDFANCDYGSDHWWFQKVKEALLRTSESPRLLNAYTRARQARFEQKNHRYVQEFIGKQSAGHHHEWTGFGPQRLSIQEIDRPRGKRNA